MTVRVWIKMVAAAADLSMLMEELAVTIMAEVEVAAEQETERMGRTATLDRRSPLEESAPTIQFLAQPIILVQVVVAAEKEASASAARLAAEMVGIINTAAWLEHFTEQVAAELETMKVVTTGLTVEQDFRASSSSAMQERNGAREVSLAAPVATLFTHSQVQQRFTLRRSRVNDHHTSQRTWEVSQRPSRRLRHR
jgi:hypothetical protein